jgi:hypothetical protein
MSTLPVFGLSEAPGGRPLSFSTTGASCRHRVDLIRHKFRWPEPFKRPRKRFWGLIFNFWGLNVNAACFRLVEAQEVVQLSFSTIGASCRHRVDLIRHKFRWPEPFKRPRKRFWGLIFNFWGLNVNAACFRLVEAPGGRPLSFSTTGASSRHRVDLIRHKFRWPEPFKRPRKRFWGLIFNFWGLNVNAACFRLVEAPGGRPLSFSTTGASSRHRVDLIRHKFRWPEPFKRPRKRFWGLIFNFWGLNVNAACFRLVEAPGGRPLSFSTTGASSRHRVDLIRHKFRWPEPFKRPRKRFWGLIFNFWGLNVNAACFRLVKAPGVAH